MMQIRSVLNMRGNGDVISAGNDRISPTERKDLELTQWSEFIP